MLDGVCRSKNRSPAPQRDDPKWQVWSRQTVCYSQGGSCCRLKQYHIEVFFRMKCFRFKPVGFLCPLHKTLNPNRLPTLPSARLVSLSIASALFRKSATSRIDEGVRDAVEQMFDIVRISWCWVSCKSSGVAISMFVVNATGDQTQVKNWLSLNPILSRPRGTAVQSSPTGLRADVRPTEVVIEAGSGWSAGRIDLDGFQPVLSSIRSLEGRLFIGSLMRQVSMKRDLELLEASIMGSSPAVSCPRKIQSG